MVLSKEALATAADQIARARKHPAAPIGHMPPGSAPRDLLEAMQLQDVSNASLSHGGLGEVVGTKIGCTTKVMQEYLGMIEPCTGAIFETTLHENQATLQFDSYLHVGVECEIAVRLSRDILAAHAPHTMESLSKAIGSVHAAIEIVDDRYVDFAARKPDWMTWVADNFFGAGAVIGPAVEDWRRLDLAATEGTMRINDKLVGSGFGKDIINGHPLEALVWLANEAGRSNRDLPAGWLVMLGSVVQTKWVAKGDFVKVDVAGLGRATAQF